MARDQMSEKIANMEYDYTCVSGEVVVDIDATKLAGVVVNEPVSGESFTLFDGETSGGVAIGNVYAADERPFQLDYHVGVNSGVVVVSSGATWNITVLTT